MTRRHQHAAAVARRLEALRGGLPSRPVTAAVIAAQSENTRCGLLTVANAAGIKVDGLLSGTPWEMPFGPANSAIVRGRAFERMVKAEGYRRLLEMLRDALGFDIRSVRVANLKERFRLDPKDPYRSLRARADATAELIEAHLARNPDAPNLIDGAILTVELGGQVGYVETDSIALRFDGPIRVGEIKSFPIVDGRADPEKVGAAADQSAVYVLAMQDLVDRLGGDAERDVSTEILLIGAKNMGMIPVLYRHDVGRRIAHHRRQLAGAPDLEALVARVPPSMTFPGPETPNRADVIADIANATGTHYQPRCLSFCGMARWCRNRAREADEPGRLGPAVVRLIPGVGSLVRAGELAAGAPSRNNEAPAAAALMRAARLIRAASSRRRRVA